MPRSKSEAAFLSARSEWDSRFSDLARGKRNWQLAALGLLLANVTLAGGLTWLSTQARVTPFVVEVDRLGQAVAFGPAERLRKSDERLIRYQLGMLVHDLRTVLTDQEAQKEMIDKSGQMGVPVIDIDGTIIVGFDVDKIKAALGM